MKHRLWKGTLPATLPQMRRRQHWLRAAGVGAVVALALGWASPAWAPPCTYCTTSGLMLPLSGLVFVPPNPCIGTAGESVSLVGDVHAVTKVGLNFVADVHLNMAGVNGVGQTTGNMYIGTGSNRFLGVQLIPNQLPGGPIRASFTLEPTDGCASVPLPLTFELVPSSDGTLQTSSTASVAACNVDGCF
jgi:hypothetical protein